MGVLPVPDEIREMAAGIRALSKSIDNQNKILEKIHMEVADMRSALVKNDLAGKLDGIHGTLTTAKDALRLLSGLMERKL